MKINLKAPLQNVQVLEIGDGGGTELVERDLGFLELMPHLKHLHFTEHTWTTSQLIMVAWYVLVFFVAEGFGVSVCVLVCFPQSV